MENDLISRSAAINAIHDYEVGCMSLDERARLAGMSAVLNRIPTAAAAPVVHARWEPHYGTCGFPINEQCSKCGKVSHNGKTAFCPNCGAKMESEGGT